MTSWLSAKAEELAQAAKAKAEELQEGAKLLSETVGTFNKAGNDNLKDLEFEDGKFGFRLDGTLVVHVEPDGQADRLGVVLGDRLVKVAGYDVPEYEIGDTEGEQRAGQAAKSMMKDMPPPLRLTFAPPPALEALVDSDDEAEEDATQLEPLAEADEEVQKVEQEEEESMVETNATEVPKADEVEVEKAPSETDLPSEKAETSAPPVAAAPPVAPSPPVAQTPLVAKASPVVKAPPAPSRSSQNDSSRDKAALKEAKQARAILIGNLEAEKKQSAMFEKKAAELAEELEIYKAQNSELLLAASQGEVNNDIARGSWEAREQEMEKQIRNLQDAAAKATRDATEAASVAAAKIAAADELAKELRQEVADQLVTIEELREKHTASEERLAASDVRLTQLSNVLGGFQAAHDAELEILKEEQEKMQRRVAQAEEESERSGAAERETAIQLEQVRFDLDESRRSENRHRAEVEAAIVDAQAARVEANAARNAQFEAERKQLDAEKKLSGMAINLETSIAKEDSNSQAEDTEDTIDRLDSTGDASRFASAPVKHSGSTETSALYARIDLLQARCSALQEKLIATKTAASNAPPQSLGAGAGQRIPVWLPHVMNICGPTAGQLAMLLYGSIDRILRGATQRLLSRDMWLWLFWMHLVVLYTISASCYSQHAHAEPSTPSESINKFLSKTGAVSTVPAAVAAATAPR